jgi:hemolysin activation/secretion protein
MKNLVKSGCILSSFTFLSLISVISIAPSRAHQILDNRLQNSSLDFKAIAQVTEPLPATQIQVKKIKVIGSTVFKEADFQPIIKSIEGKTVTSEELQQIADKITGLYLERNYITSRAVIDDDTIGSDILQIRVIEGSLAAIEIQGAQRLENYVRSRIELGTSTPLNSARLEDQLRLLRIDPLFENIEASLKAGKGVGQSILVVRVNEADPFEGSISIDNYSPPSVGAERINLNLIYRNLTGLGDSIAASYRPRIEDFDGTYQLEFAYSIPLNAMNGKLGLRTVIDRNQVVNGQFEVLDIQGESERYEINYRQPIILNPRQELALSVGFAYQDNQLFTFQGPTRFGFGPDEEGITRTSVLTFGQEYTVREPSGAWGLRSQFRFGVGFFEATSNAGDIPDSEFFSWLGQIQRVQVFSEDNFLILQLDLQLTTDPLLPSEQFVVGGAQSVRGYRQNILAGDNGVRFSVEDRIILARNDAENPVFTLAPFFDMGVIWNDPENPNTIISDNNFIAGLGLGLIWQPIEGLNLRLDYAPPLMDLNIRGDNVQDDGFYFSAGYTF